MKKIIIPVFLCAMFVFSIATGARAEYVFYDGTQWNKIAEQPFTVDEKKQIKTLILKTAHSVSAFSGQPILGKSKSDYETYIPDVDRFYSNKRNTQFPVSFALKIASMRRQGIPEAQINIFMIAVEKKLAKT